MGLRLKGRLWAPREWKLRGNAAIGADFSSGTDWGVEGKVWAPILDRVMGALVCQHLALVLVLRSPETPCSLACNPVTHLPRK